MIPIAVEAVGLLKEAKQGLTALGEGVASEIAALTEAEEALAATAEGFDVAVNAKRADIAAEADALDSTMSSLDKAKDGVKSSEGAAAGASKAGVEWGSKGGYQDAGYHHWQSTGKAKSRAPKSGIEALNNSAEVLNNGGLPLVNKQRIGISDGEFVVLNRTSKGITRDKDIFHGHACEWDGLRKNMKEALEKAGLTNGNGKILK